MGLCENLKRLRLAHNLTLEMAGQAIGVSRQTILRYENGVIANPPSEKIEALAAVYHTTPSRLMGWEERTQPRAAFYGGSQESAARQEDFELLASLDKADEEELRLRAIWDTLGEEQRRSLLQYARFLTREGGFLK